MRHSAVSFVIIALYIPLFLCYAEERIQTKNKEQERWTTVSYATALWQTV